jgi:hypothetical protein
MVYHYKSIYKNKYNFLRSKTQFWELNYQKSIFFVALNNLVIGLLVDKNARYFHT